MNSYRPDGALRDFCRRIGLCPNRGTACPTNLQSLLCSRSLFSNKTTVELDFGQYASWWSADRNLVDENGESIQFNSVLDAVNYMAARGWIFEQMYVVQTFTKGDSNTPAYHWIMSKDVSDPAQIMEGLQTRGDKK